MKPAERARFRQHLAGCAACQRRLDAITALGQSLRAMPSPQLGLDLAAQWNDRLNGSLDDRLRAPPQGVDPCAPGLPGQAGWAGCRQGWRAGWPWCRASGWAACC
ncbi:anti-sigma factor family protein [Acidovorax carolinensis]|uniref:anti-sigma factor family protein n=1 Tax=Acidovorax carolinensis TaxID=553814 RepID=UPI001F4596AD|nr:zf-HC2 domain-containing protein [Acidovorax carolinensis]